MNYKLEGPLIFKEEFNKLLCNKEDNLDMSCLIGSEPLEEFYIKLKCGHSFNYLNIFKEIQQQKYHKNRLETQKLEKNL